MAALIRLRAEVKLLYALLPLKAAENNTSRARLQPEMKVMKKE
jgi:hypothetical protein